MVFMRKRTEHLRCASGICLWSSLGSQGCGQGLQACLKNREKVRLAPVMLRHSAKSQTPHAIKLMLHIQNMLHLKN